MAKLFQYARGFIFSDNYIRKITDKIDCEDDFLPFIATSYLQNQSPTIKVDENLRVEVMIGAHGHSFEGLVNKYMDQAIHDDNENSLRISVPTMLREIKVLLPGMVDGKRAEANWRMVNIKLSSLEKLINIQTGYFKSLDSVTDNYAFGLLEYMDSGPWQWRQVLQAYDGLLKFYKRFGIQYE